MTLTKKRPTPRRKICSSAILSTTNPKWAFSDSIPSLCIEQQVTNLLGHGKSWSGYVPHTVYLIRGLECPEGGWGYKSTLSLTSTLDGSGCQRHAPAALAQERDTPSFFQEAGWAPWPARTSAQKLTSPRSRSADRPARSEWLYRLHWIFNLIFYYTYFDYGRGCRTFWCSLVYKVGYGDCIWFSHWIVGTRKTTNIHFQLQ